LLEKILQKEFIQLNVDALDWRDAIKKSAKPLLDYNKISKEYISAMIESVEEFGPYIVLVKHVALAHAKPGNSVKELAMSALTLNHPVNFHHESNDPVSLVFTLAAPDSCSHLDALKKWAEVVNNEEKVQLLKQCTNVEQFKALMVE